MVEGTNSNDLCYRCFEELEDEMSTRLEGLEEEQEKMYNRLEELEQETYTQFGKAGRFKQTFKKFCRLWGRLLAARITIAVVRFAFGLDEEKKVIEGLLVIGKMGCGRRGFLNAT